jgi:hypothetical protein
VPCTNTFPKTFKVSPSNVKSVEKFEPVNDPVKDPVAVVPPAAEPDRSDKYCVIAIL